MRRRAGDLLDALVLVMWFAGILFYTAGRGVIDGALGDQAGKMSLDTVYALYVLNQAFASVGHLLLGLFGLATGLLSLDVRLLPLWLAIASGVLLVIGVFGLSTLGGGAPGLIGLLGLFLFLLFVLVSSVVRLMRNRVVPVGAGPADS